MQYRVQIDVSGLENGCSQAELTAVRISALAFFYIFFIQAEKNSGLRQNGRNEGLVVRPGRNEGLVVGPCRNEGLVVEPGRNEGLVVGPGRN